MFFFLGVAESNGKKFVFFFFGTEEKAKPYFSFRLSDFRFGPKEATSLAPFASQQQCFSGRCLRALFI